MSTDFSVSLDFGVAHLKTYSGNIYIYIYKILDGSCWQSDKMIFQTIPVFKSSRILDQFLATLDIRNA